MEKAPESKDRWVQRVAKLNWAKVRTAIYATQAVLVAIAWVMAIYILSQSGGIGGAVAYYFFLVSAFRQQRMPLTVRCRRGYAYPL
jgi:hypothetical protein